MKIIPQFIFIVIGIVIAIVTFRASRAAIQADVPGIAANYTKQYNAKSADALVGDMRGLVDKWTRLVGPVNDPDQIAELFWRESYSKIDVKTYGLQ